MTSPQNERRRPAGNGTATSAQMATEDFNQGTTAGDALARLRRRAAAGARAELRHERRRGRRIQAYFDAHTEQELSRPSDWGMTADELRDYAQQLRREGWSDWEIRARLADPREVRA